MVANTNVIGYVADYFIKYKYFIRCGGCVSLLTFLFFFSAAVFSWRNNVFIIRYFIRMGRLYCLCLAAALKAGCVPWRPECHKQIIMATDASSFKYGSVVLSGRLRGLNFSDFWANNDTRLIHLKEADAVLQALQSLGSDIFYHRVDLFTDNMALLCSWEHQGGKDLHLNALIKHIFEWIFTHNIDLKMCFIPSASNEADLPSRSLSFSDSMLSCQAWQAVEDAFGPHTANLMSLDSNAMHSASGALLKHYTPNPTPKSSGVNLFAQNISEDVNPYVFLPFNRIFPTFNYLRQQHVRWCTFIVPKFEDLPVWWPMFQQTVSSAVCLGRQGDRGELLVPTKKGFVADYKGLRWNLYAFRLSLPSLFSLQVQLNSLELEIIDACLQDLKTRMQSSSYAAKVDHVRRNFNDFLTTLPTSPTVLNVLPYDVTRYLVCKDNFGKTQVHFVSCIHLGKKGIFE